MENQYRNNLEWRLLLRYKSFRLPLICDPSHITGKRDMIFDTCQMALDLSFDGLMVESHWDPDNA